MNDLVFDENDRFSRAGIERGPHLAGLYTVQPYNAKYLTGEVGAPSSDWVAWFAGIVIVTFAFGSAWLVFDLRARSAFMPSPTWLLLVMAGIDAYLLYRMIQAIRRMRQWARRGVLCLGTVVASDGELKSEGFGRSRHQVYELTVEYRIELPDGRAVQGRQTEKRPDYRRARAPEPGEQIAALYLPETGEVLLL